MAKTPLPTHPLFIKVDSPMIPGARMMIAANLIQMAHPYKDENFDNAIRVELSVLIGGELKLFYLDNEEWTKWLKETA